MCRRVRVRAQRGALADLAERQAAVAALRHLGEDLGRVRGELDAEARRELRNPLELVRAGRRRGPAQALQAAFDVHVGALALEVARTGQDEVGPADRKSVEHRDGDHRVCALCKAAHVRIAGGFVARDDQEADRLRIARLRVGGCGPGVGDAASVRRRGHEERAAAVLAGQAELLRELCDAHACAAAGA